MNTTREKMLVAQLSPMRDRDDALEDENKINLSVNTWSDFPAEIKVRRGRLGTGAFLVFKLIPGSKRGNHATYHFERIDYPVSHSEKVG